MNAPIKIKRANVSWIIIALSCIILLGTLLRSYHFSHWIYYGDDQDRDFKLIANIVSGRAHLPLLGPDMTGGRGFLLGPGYYYFQIISAKLFGLSQASQAYPDLFFGILAIPLLFLFLSELYSAEASLFSTALFAVSFFAIEYSRFAWNVNLIPFFLILYLISLWKLLTEETKTSWLWVMALGAAVGIGVQLHALLLTTLPALSLLAMLFAMHKNPQVWKKWALAICVVLALNITQFVHEFTTNFQNTKTFFGASSFKEGRAGNNLEKNLALDVACNSQANMHFISSLGNKNICDFLYRDPGSSFYATPISITTDPLKLTGIALSIIITLIGYLMLFYAFKNSTDRKKKYLLGIILAYLLIYFLIMIPIAGGSRMRYYLPMIFVPFLMFAMFFDNLKQKMPHYYLIIMIVFATIFTGLNLNTLYNEAQRISVVSGTEQKIMTPSGNAYIGEINFLYRKKGEVITNKQ